MYANTYVPYWLTTSQEVCMNIDEKIGQRFRTLRELRGRQRGKKLTLREVSESLNDIGFTYLGDLERGEKRWKHKQIVALAEYYNVPPSLITDQRIPIEHVELIGSIVGELSNASEEMLEAFLSMLQAKK